MTIIDEIAQHLHNQGVAVLGTSLFKLFLPPTPAAAMVVVDTGGLPPHVELPFEEPTFQVFIRAESYSDGRNKLAAVRTALHGVQNQQLVPGGRYFILINALAEGGHVGRNENGNEEFSINFHAKVRQESWS